MSLDAIALLLLSDVISLPYRAAAVYLLVRSQPTVLMCSSTNYDKSVRTELFQAIFTWKMRILGAIFLFNFTSPRALSSILTRVDNGKPGAATKCVSKTMMDREKTCGKLPQRRFLLVDNTLTRRSHECMSSEVCFEKAHWNLLENWYRR
jgi:hypothetical protein